MDSSVNMIQVVCPACRGPLSAPAHFAGATVQCPRCASQMMLPLAAGATQPTAPPVAVSAAKTPAPRRVEDLLPPSSAPAPAAPASSAGRATFRGDPSKPSSTAAAATETTGSDTELTAGSFAGFPPRPLNSRRASSPRYNWRARSRRHRVPKGYLYAGRCWPSRSFVACWRRRRCSLPSHRLERA